MIRSSRLATTSHSVPHQPGLLESYPVRPYFLFKKKEEERGQDLNPGAGEMTQQLRSLAAVPEDQRYISSAHLGAPVPRDAIPSSGLAWKCFTDRKTPKHIKTFLQIVIVSLNS